MSIKLYSIEIIENYVEIILTSKSYSNVKFKALLNDFDEVNNGELIDCDFLNNEYRIKLHFELTERFKQFHDGILKIIVQGTSNQSLYYTIYSLDMWEKYNDDINKVESYFNNLDDDIDFISIGYENDDIPEFDRMVMGINESQNEVIETDKPRFLYDLNGYSNTWLSMKLDDWSLDYTTNDKLFAEFVLTYKENQANFLKDVNFYITTNRGSIIYFDGYLTRDGKVPDKIDIWMDGLKHVLYIGPCFPISKGDELIQEGIRLTMCFKDIKQGYYVRKTYIMESDMWYHEELYAVPLNQFST